MNASILFLNCLCRDEYNIIITHLCYPVIAHLCSVTSLVSKDTVSLCPQYHQSTIFTIIQRLLGIYALNTTSLLHYNTTSHNTAAEGFQFSVLQSQSPWVVVFNLRVVCRGRGRGGEREGEGIGQ